MNFTHFSVSLITALVLSGSAHAQEAGRHASSHTRDVTLAQAASAMSEGTVRKVNRDSQKITIKHGPIENLGMPPMTMVFRVKDPAMLDLVKAGDNVRFSADKIGGAYTVTALQPVR